MKSINTNQITENSKPVYQSPYEDIFEAAAKGWDKDVKYFVETKGVRTNVTKWDPARLFWGNAYTSAEEERLTPLHLAAKYNHVEVVKYLISQGADVNAETTWGNTPLDLANNEEKKNILREAGGQGNNSWLSCY